VEVTPKVVRLRKVILEHQHEHDRVLETTGHAELAAAQLKSPGRRASIGSLDAVRGWCIHGGLVLWHDHNRNVASCYAERPWTIDVATLYVAAEDHETKRPVRALIDGGTATMWSAS